MPNPSEKWDMVPVYGVWLRFDQSPEPGRVKLTVSQRINRVDGRVIYPGGATVTVEIGDQAAQDPTVRAQVRGAWRAADQAAQGAAFDGVAWDQWWDTVVVPAAIFTAFPASDDPDIVQTGYQVSVQESLTAGQGKQYYVQPLLAQLEQTIPGINLGEIEVPPGSVSAPAPIYQKNKPGGVAGLDADGKIHTNQLPASMGGWVRVTQAEYDALPTKDANTLYVITGD